MKIVKSAGAAVMSLGLVVGLAGFAGATSGTIGNTGPWSYNHISSNNRHTATLDNDNDLNASSFNSQDARSGDASSFFNTTAGGAETGSAHNSNSSNVSASVNNGGGLGLSGMFGGSGANSASIDTTGPGSRNSVSFNDHTYVRVSNDNDLRVTNTNFQDAHSGNARVSGNTTGGSAITGDASNSNSQTVNLSVSN